MNSKTYNILILFLIIVFLPVQAICAEHYVRAGASGSNNGSDWANAYSSLPSSLTRGDTYYIADGSYNSYSFDDPTSGTLYIYIKKATASEHGINTGWSDTYGDGTALFTGQSAISTNYWDIDGKYGQLDGTFGIKFKQNGDSKCVRIGGGVGYVNLKYVEMEHAGYSSASLSNADCLYMNAGSTSPIHHVTISYSWLHNATRTAVFTWNVIDSTWTNCWFTEVICVDAYAVHGEAFSINATPNQGNGNTIKNSYFRNIEGSGWIVWNNNFGAYHYNWDVYNNVFYTDADHILDGWDGVSIAPQLTDFTGSDGVVVVLNTSPATIATNINVYGNTFCNIQQSGSTVRLDRPGVTSTNTNVYNNLFISPNRTAGWTGTDVRNNISTSDLSYVNNYNNQNYTLARETAAGIALQSPYNRDMLNNTRGLGMVWDVGAFEYVEGDGGGGGGGGGSAVATPLNLRKAAKLNPVMITASTHDGNVPGNTVDEDLGTRWSAQGSGQWIEFDLGADQTLSHMMIAFFMGDQQIADFSINTSMDGNSWTQHYRGNSQATTQLAEYGDIDDSHARYVRIIGYGSNVNDWNSITEVEIFEKLP